MNYLHTDYISRRKEDYTIMNRSFNISKSSVDICLNELKLLSHYWIVWEPGFDYRFFSSVTVGTCPEDNSFHFFTFSTQHTLPSNLCLTQSRYILIIKIWISFEWVSEWVITEIGREITWGQIRLHHHRGAFWDVGNRGTGELGSSVMRASEVRAQMPCVLETPLTKRWFLLE